MVIEIDNEQDFQDKVVNGQGYLLVAYTATWCGPCRAMEPIVENEASRYENKLTLVEIDIDMIDSEVLAKHRVRATPTYHLFLNGEIIDKQVGGIPSDGFKRFLSKNIPY